MENNLKDRTLRKQMDFNNLRKLGRRFTVKNWLTINYIRNDVGYLRFSCTISAKTTNAVKRNRIKRWIKELVLSCLKEGVDPSIDLNFYFRSIGSEFYDKLQFKELESSFKSFINKNKFII